MEVIESVIVSIKHLGIVDCNRQCSRLILTNIMLVRLALTSLLPRHEIQHWLGHLPSLASPAHFTCSQVFIEYYTKGHIHDLQSAGPQPLDKFNALNFSRHF